MTSNRTGKTSSDDTTQKLSSTVPNDYQHLGVPGSLNMPLGGSKRRRAQARRRGRYGGMPGWAKALLAMGGAFFAFGIVMLVIFIIAFPPFFRNLEPRYQQRLIDMFPPFESLRPTVPFEVLPTLSGASDSQDAQNLLLTPQQAVVTPQPGSSDLSQSQPPGSATPATPGTPVPTPTLAPTATGGIPVGMELTPEQATPLPVYIPPTQQSVAALPTFTPLVPPTEVPLPYNTKLTGIRYEQQGWNNCGPTTLTMALSYYGWLNNEATAAKWLKPNTEDKNVSPWQLVRYVNEQVYPNLGTKALYRIGGNTTLLKRLLAAGFPVMIEESIQPAGEDWMGHYVLLIGYDDLGQQFLTFDSYLGSNKEQGRPSPYSLFDDKWRHFNRVFIVVYKPEREMDLRAALGPYVDPAYGYQMALEVSRAEASKDREDAWAWFNMGTAYVHLKDYYHAATAFDEALRIGLPWRMFWYQFGAYEAFFYTGRYTDMLAYAQATIATTPYVEESYYWQDMAYAAQGNTQAALAEFRLALQYNYNFFPAQDAKAQVEAGTFTVASAGS